MWIYRDTGNDTETPWEVGYFVEGVFILISAHISEKQCMDKVHYLNGGTSATVMREIKESLRSISRKTL